MCASACPAGIGEGLYHDLVLKLVSIKNLVPLAWFYEIFLSSGSWLQWDSNGGNHTWQRSCRCVCAFPLWDEGLSSQTLNINFDQFTYWLFSFYTAVRRSKIYFHWKYDRSFCVYIYASNLISGTINVSMSIFNFDEGFRFIVIFVFVFGIHLNWHQAFVVITCSGFFW